MGKVKGLDGKYKDMSDAQHRVAQTLFTALVETSKKSFQMLTDLNQDTGVLKVEYVHRMSNVTYMRLFLGRGGGIMVNEPKRSG